MSAPMIDAAQVYEECKRIRIECEKVVADNIRLRDLLLKTATHIEKLGDIVSAAMIRELAK